MANEKLGLGQVPAFACTYEMKIDGKNKLCYHDGMSKREYAAIHLRVPDSGEEWLDEMIKKANRMDAAREFIATLLSRSDLYHWNHGHLIQFGLTYADELLKQENHE